MLEGRNPSRLAVALILVALVAAGPSWASSPELGDGSASVEIVAPEWLDAGTGPTGHELVTRPGRFGTRASYLPLPDLVVDVHDVSGQPKLRYDVAVPALAVDPPAEERLLTGPGRYRLHLSDVALPPRGYEGGGPTPPEPGVYTGRVTVRVQSFSGQTVVANRTVAVRVEP